VTSAGVFALWSLADADADADAGDAPAAGAGAGPETDDGALALYLWTWVGETFANVVIWRRPRVALAGGLAMGAFALPALRTRLLAGR
jgi:putative membrane protein